MSTSNSAVPTFISVTGHRSRSLTTSTTASVLPSRAATDIPAMKRLRFLPLLALLGFCVLPSARATDASSPDNKRNYNHTLALADRVRIAIYQEDDLTSVTRIDARGKVNLPLVGEISLGGLTIVDAQTAIENAYKNGRFLRNPQVTVSVEEYS